MTRLCSNASPGTQSRRTASWIPCMVLHQAAARPSLVQYAILFSSGMKLKQTVYARPAFLASSPPSAFSSLSAPVAVWPGGEAAAWLFHVARMTASLCSLHLPVNLCLSTSFLATGWPVGLLQYQTMARPSTLQQPPCLPWCMAACTFHNLTFRAQLLADTAAAAHAMDYNELHTRRIHCLNTDSECNARCIKSWPTDWIFRLGSSLLRLVTAGSWGCVLEVHATMGRFGGSGFPLRQLTMVLQPRPPYACWPPSRRCSSRRTQLAPPMYSPMRGRASRV